MERYVKLKTFCNGKDFFTQSFSKAKKYLDSGGTLIAYILVEDGVMCTHQIVKINEKEAYFITEYDIKFIITGKDNEVKKIVVTGFYNKTKNELYTGTEVTRVKIALGESERLYAMYYYKPKNITGITSKIVEINFEKKTFMIETGTVYRFSLDDKKE